MGGPAGLCPPGGAEWGGGGAERGAPSGESGGTAASQKTGTGGRNQVGRRGRPQTGAGGEKDGPPPPGVQGREWGLGGAVRERRAVISPECGVRFTGSRKDGDQRRVTTGARLPRPEPSPLPHLSMPGGPRAAEACVSGWGGEGCLGIRARWGCGSGPVGFLLSLFIGQQNLRQDMGRFWLCGA